MRLKIFILVFIPLFFTCESLLAQPFADFVSVNPNTRDATLRLPETHTFQKIIQEGDLMTGGASFISNVDFTGYVPIKGSSINGYLSINNEADNGGVTMLDINYNQTAKLWNVTHSEYVDFSAFGRTARNCSGGVTPWGTIITSEEVSNTFNDINNDGYLDYGWQVEIDPASKQVIDKRWALGRFAHENIVVHKNWRTVYQGADNSSGYLYKFVADFPADLSSGKLYVYKGSKTGGSGQWILIPNTTKNQRNNTKFQAQSVGATSFNGIEDVEIGPDGLIYFAVKSENKIYYLEDSDPVNGTSVSFLNKFAGNRNYTINTVNGNVSHYWGYGNDNLAFDNEGNLWVLQDGQNSHIWVVRKGHTEANPKVEVFATTPKSCEPTGITFSPDGRFIFLSIQHPNGYVWQKDAADNNMRFNSDATLVIARKEHLGSECLGSCPDCDDNIQNYAENGTDCGGSCENCPTCFDRIKNGNETGIDCGGNSCISCPSLNITKTNTTCNGIDDGTAIAMVTGGAGTITYLWSTGDTLSRLENLKAGNYSLKISDSNGNRASRNFSILESAQLNVTGSVNFPTAFNVNNGAISINVSGGETPYTYEWSNNASSKNISNLSTGIYTVGVTDANGCTVYKAFNIELLPCSNFEVSLYSKGVNCANENNGIATALVAGGTGPFNYSWSNGGNTKTIENLSTGNYSVTVTDGNNCTATNSVLINAPSNPLTVSLNAINTSGIDTNTGLVSGSVSGGQSPYKYKWSTGANSSSIFNLKKGAYTLQVTDKRGCIAQQVAIVNEHVCPTITANISTTNISCYGLNDGKANAAISGGVAPYNVKWSNAVNGTSTQNLTVGTHSVSVIDAKGCSKDFDFVITEPTPLSTQATITHPTDNSNNNGSIAVNTFGGAGSYTYNWSTGATATNINNLTNGDYSVTVADINNCSVTNNFQIQPDTCSYLSVQLTKNDLDCFEAGNGDITANATGAILPVSYSWSTGNNSNSIANLQAGIYSVTVIDSAGCEAYAEAEIMEPSNGIDVDIFLKEVSNVGGNDAEARATVSGGKAPYTYNWSNGNSSANVSNLSPGTYTLTVTDANNCATNKSITINDLDCSNMKILLTVENRGCAGIADATILGSVENGTNPISYDWSNGTTTPFLKNINSIGTYSLTATDAKGCSKSKNVNISNNASLQITENVTNLNAYNANNGAISTNVNGGNSPYYYYWGNASNLSSISNLSAGTYDVLAADEFGCTILKTNTVNNYNCNFKVSSLVENTSCKNGNDGKITLSATGGNSPYNFNWVDINQNTNVRNNLNGNTYEATVTDNKNCITTVKAEVESPTNSFSVNVNKTNETYFNRANGTATAIPSGGVQPVSYQWSTGLGNEKVNNLPAGNYSVEATDANGCKAVKSFSITGINCNNTALNVNKTDVDCFEEANGTATAVASGVTTPYSIFWLNGDIGSNSNSLDVNNYAAYVIDAVGCRDDANFAITEPAELTLTSNKTNITYLNSANGTASVNVSGGVAPYSYSWNTGATTNAVSNLSSGQYIVNITDGNDCALSQTFIIEDVDCKNIDISGVTQKNVTCRNDRDGEITVQVTGGNAPFSYAWSNGGNQAKITNLSSGSYTVNITDKFGCKDARTVSLANPLYFNVNLTTTDITVGGTNNGSATLAIAGGVQPYNINWSNGATTTSVNNFGPGTHNYTVVDANGCSRAGDFTLCTPPYNVKELSVANNSAVIGWEGDIVDNNYVYQYRNVTDGSNWKTGTTTNAFLLLNNLPNCKTFEFGVFGNCSSTNGTFTQFVTSGCAGCTATNNLYHFNVRDISAFINWDLVPGANYTLFYRKVGSSSWFSYNTSITYAILFGLDPCSTYEWYVDTNCENGGVFHTNLKDRFTTLCLKEENADANERIDNIELALEVYPNPARDNISLMVNTNSNFTFSEATISLYNLAGKQIMTETNVELLNVYQLDITGLTNGMYVLEVKIGDLTKEVKFVKE